MERFICRACKRGPSGWTIWPFDMATGDVYCPTCRQRPELVQDTETVRVLDLNGDHAWPVELGGEC